MAQTGENLPFVEKATGNPLRLQALLDDFDGDGLLELLIGATGEIDRAHATLTEYPVDFICADFFAYQRMVGMQ